MPASGGRPFCEYADEGCVLCARGAGSVYAHPIGSLMLDRLRDFFVCVCDAMRGGMGRSDGKIRPAWERAEMAV